MNKNDPKSLCFCTSAFGRKYNLMAQLLAQDLHEFAPGYVFLIYSDRPQMFKDNPNVLAVKHSCRGVQSYNERRFAIWHALTIASSAMYLDSDVRICAPIPKDLDFAPGLTARSCGSLQKHLKSQISKNPNSRRRKRKQYVIEQMAHHAGIDINLTGLKFINEFLFVVTRDKGREREFLKYWGELAVFADTFGMHKHPTYAMALAAEKSGLPIFRDEMNGLDFFDDRIEKYQISKGKSTPEAKAEYFRQQQQIEQAKKGILGKILGRANMQSKLIYNRARVQVLSKFLLSSLINYPSLDKIDFIE